MKPDRPDGWFWIALGCSITAAIVTMAAVAFGLAALADHTPFPT